MLPPWIKRYWKLYGGWRAVLRSRYFQLALVISLICYPLWIDPNYDWMGISLSVLPNLMGFSVAGLSIMLAFSHPQSLKAVTQQGKEDSYFLKTIANLCHFLFLQVIALLLAIVGKGIHHPVLSYLGVLALLYAILASVGAAGQLFNTARIMNEAANGGDKK